MFGVAQLIGQTGAELNHYYVLPLIFLGWSSYSLESEGTTRTDRKDPSLCSGDIECDDVEDGVGGTLI